MWLHFHERERGGEPSFTIYIYILYRYILFKIILGQPNLDFYNIQSYKGQILKPDKSLVRCTLFRIISTKSGPDNI